MLPPLIFGNAQSQVQTDLNRFRDYIAQVRNTVTNLDSIDPSIGFQQKISHISINTLTITATASTPVLLSTEETEAHFLTIPFTGQAQTSVNGQSYDWNAGQAAFLSVGERPCGRALQYSFMKTYGCSPMVWVRQQRLLKARDRLLSAQPGTTVTTIAIECGFRSNSAFSTYYQQQFGERPSETLLRANQ